MSHVATPTIRNGSFGKPGIKAMRVMPPAAMRRARRWLRIWNARSVPRSDSVPARVTMMPVEIEMSSAGS